MFLNLLRIYACMWTFQVTKYGLQHDRKHEVDLPVQIYLQQRIQAMAELAMTA